MYLTYDILVRADDLAFLDGRSKVGVVGRDRGSRSGSNVGVALASIGNVSPFGIFAAPAFEAFSTEDDVKVIAPRDNGMRMLLSLTCTSSWFVLSRLTVAMYASVSSCPFASAAVLFRFFATGGFERALNRLAGVHYLFVDKSERTLPTKLTLLVESPHRQTTEKRMMTFATPWCMAQCVA